MTNDKVVCESDEMLDQTSLGLAICRPKHLWVWQDATPNPLGLGYVLDSRC
jgi:hypothetical protein